MSASLDHNAWPLPPVWVAEQRGQQLYLRALESQKGAWDKREFTEFRDALVMFALYELPVLLNAVQVAVPPPAPKPERKDG